MDVREFESYAGRRHPWESSRARALAKVLVRAGCRPTRWLDVGAGDAYTAHAMRERLRLGSSQTASSGKGCELVCVDQAYDDEAIRSRIGVNFPDTQLLTSLDALPVRGAKGVARGFDLITMLDVLEHVEDDLGMLRRVVRQQLAADGYLLISVPAGPKLFSAHDRALGHHRRYEPSQLLSLVERCGLDMLDSGSLFSSLYAVRRVQVSVEAVAGTEEALGVSAWRGPAWLTRAIEGALAVDHALARRARKYLGVTAPGLSTWILARTNAS